ncbi:reverse transcriptase family protein [Pseudomonas syringae]|uniref:RNA-directed DNA polymerase n=2 Tax=Pseudomonas syringae TaxID=317 RepID=A0A656JN72_PSESF|nr:reverse transcriptase family protein [Pseudomonas syringae]EPN39827.1 RNA-directed DNA polymerase [Pseudomonas syringae pv. actinidiae ICMP 19096]EPM45452.1 RNA-directed DNA polymerase [Pseudomonas syringae pv. actinidiae ICMP 19098]EPM65250.1 RNA-directed DNA polymerase [Pseudomonas syringae pv. actinidiae ICMP 18804]EPN17000.1 RNA-directed DNA polymerase [Pseudomonas syringae pv. actinidiae ICMP 19100]EPN24761.1 RNA-directed DNA polymerase [Pseudomonas syringae pv. actinidiae ICMP 19099]
MNRWSPQRYLKAGRQEGVPETTLQNAVYTAKQMKHGCPPIFSLNHLSHLTGTTYTFLHETVSRDNEEEAYKVFRLRKPNVGHSPDRFRWICAPTEDLLRVQRWINAHILSKIEPHEASYAYDNRHGVLEAAELHCEARWLIKLDLTNFFESILEPQVYELFKSLGYQPLVAFELARLCTRLRVSGNPDRRYKNKTPPEGLPYTGDSRIGHLPQGAASSPRIANLVMQSLDENLQAYATENDLAYSRYADDLVFSSKGAFDRSEATQHIKSINNCLVDEGFWLNKAKTKIITPGTRKIVLGLLVDGKKPRLPKSYKKYVSDHLYYLSHPTIDAMAHAESRGFQSLQGLINHVSGKIAYGFSIEPDWGKQQGDRLKGICRTLQLDHVIFP